MKITQRITRKECILYFKDKQKHKISLEIHWKNDNTLMQYTMKNKIINQKMENTNKKI